MHEEDHENTVDDDNRGLVYLRRRSDGLKFGGESNDGTSQYIEKHVV